MAIGSCHFIDLPTIADSRGRLSFVEGGRHLPFQIRRVYYLYGVPASSERGAHGHLELEQLIIPLVGSVEIEIDDGMDRVVHQLDDPSRGLYISPMIWRDLRRFSEGAAVIVLASLLYDERDYFRDYQQFLEAAARK